MINDVPSTWMINQYLLPGVALQGQRICVKSVFNTEDKTPSMFLYESSDKYKFKCFSSGRSGSIVDLLMYLWNVDFQDARIKIINDYLNAGGQAKHREQLVSHKWSVKECVQRSWNKIDASYWSSYNINSTLLGQYNVRPLLSYTMTSSNEKASDYTREGMSLYGYFNNAGDLTKIYQPLGKPKFMFVKSMVQGWDQLQGHDTLGICSSMKDLLCFKSMGFDIDLIAPDSENVMLPEEHLNIIRKEHKYIFTLFDNDQPGIDAMHRYKKEMDIDYWHLAVAKDISDAVQEFGVKTIKSYISPKLEQLRKSASSHVVL
jgi:hypothetical protein